MPKLHVHLRHGVSFDPVSLRPEDVVEPDMDEYLDSAQRAQKRRRIEKIATQYIRLGRVPLILSAGLQGPFENGWKNPWVASSSKGKNRSLRKAGVEATERDRETHVDTEHARIGAHDPPADAGRNSPIPSPENSRGNHVAHDSVMSPEDDHEETQAGATQQDHSGATEFFSVDAEPPIHVETSETKSNSTWLRRPQSKPAGFRGSTHGNTDPSPTRIRKGRRQVDENGALQLASPKLPLGVLHSNPGQVLVPDTSWRSSASASMVISPVKPTEIIQQTTKTSTSAKKKHARPLEPGDFSLIASHNVPPNKQRRNAVEVPTEFDERQTSQNLASSVRRSSGFTPINAAERARISVRSNRIPHPDLRGDERQMCEGETRARAVVSPNLKSNLKSNRKSNRKLTEAPDLAAQDANTSVKSARRPPKEDIHASKESREEDRSSSRPGRQKQRKSRGSVKDTTPFARHNRVTSPTLASSTGLQYRKIGETKRTKSSSKSNPRPIAFSSPAMREHQPTTKAAAQELDSGQKANEHQPVPMIEPAHQDLSREEEVRPGRPDVYMVPASSQEQQHSYKSSRTSGYSTQAAMMLAQMEFQDGTMPSMAAEHSNSWAPLQNGTPQQEPAIPSPAFTPFHEFNAALEEEDPPETTVLQDLPISTQDLFAAASPFASSTVKKAPRPLPSNLRFSVFASGGQDSHNGQQNGAKSPTPSERIPLKDKNARVSFVSSASEKGSQDSTLRPPKATKAAELPQLDLGTSLDNLGPNGDLDFTDRFLLNYNDRT